MNSAEKFRGSMQATPSESVTKERKPGIIVISDLHGNINQWGIVKEYINNNPEKFIFILGDAIDRGDYGIEILQNIMELSNKGKVAYLPGNHDAFTYNALCAMRSGDAEEYKIFLNDITVCGLNNPDFGTVNRFLNEMDNGQLDELLKWWGEQPIQVKFSDSEGATYALSHAIFDEALYKHDPNYCLKAAADDRRRGNMEYYPSFYNSLWFREGSENAIPEGRMVLPKDCIMVAGHTPQKGNANLSHIQGVPIIYVDNSDVGDRMIGLCIENGLSKQIDLLEENRKHETERDAI